MSADPPTDWAVQDWLIVVEGLADRFHPDDESRDAQRGWQLLDTICRRCDVEPGEYIFAIDDDWGAEAANAAGPDAQPAGLPGDTFDATDWQLVADALSELADRERAVPRTRHAERLAEAVTVHEPSVSLPPISES